MRRRMAASHLGIILTPFIEDLHSRGYTPEVIQRYAQVVEHFGLWLNQTLVPLAKLEPLYVHRFLRCHLPRCHCPTPAPKTAIACRTALGRLFEFLRARKLIADCPPKAPRLGPVDRLIAAYDHHLNQVCGLSVSTRQRRQHDARKFLKWRLGQTRPRRLHINPQNVLSFVANRTRKLKSGGARHVTVSLRSFLRFLEFTGRMHPGLSGSVPQTVQPPCNPPKVLDRKQRRRFLASFPRHTPIGQRDYSIALCLSELALRADEVAGLTLDDLDWRAMTLQLGRTKQRRERLLPLPAHVAKPLANYLKRGRPQTSSRALFVRHRAPLGEPLKGRFVRRIIRRAFIRCGINLTGTHILRHTWATRAHRRGASLKLIADLLAAC